MKDITNTTMAPTITPALCRNALTLARGEMQSDAEPASALARQKLTMQQDRASERHFMFR